MAAGWRGAAGARVRRVLVALGVGGVALLVVVLATGLLTADPRGVEDNGDGYRLYCGAGLSPATVDRLASWKGGVVTGFTAGAPPCPTVQPSSALLVLRVAVLGPGSFSLSTLGWCYAVVIGLVAGCAAWACSAAGARRTVVIAVPVAPLALPAFSRFFVSTYAEPAGLLGAVTIGCGVAAVLVTRPTDRAERLLACALLGAGGLVAGTAKLAYLPLLATALLVCALVVVGTGRWRHLIGPAVAVAVVVGAVLPIRAAIEQQEATYAAVNTHDLVFTLALYELGPAAAPQLGLPPQATAYTGNGYFNGPPRPQAPWWRQAFLEQPDHTRRATYALLARHPATLARAIGVGLQATTRADLPYLASRPADPQISSPPSGDPGWSGAEQPALRAVLDTTRGPPWVPLVLVSLAPATTVAVPWIRRRAPAPARWMMAGGLAAVSALGLIAVAVLGDGYFEVFKHVWLAAYLLLVTLVCLGGAAARSCTRPCPPDGDHPLRLRRCDR